MAHGLKTDVLKADVLTTDVTEVGQICQLQITPRSLVFGTKPDHYYNPDPLQPVAELLLEPRGVTGVLESGEHLMDHHHMDHPQSHFRHANTLSIGFSAHYAQMQTRFGPHMHLGCAAENIIIQSTQRMHLTDLRRYLLIGSQAAGWVVLTDMRVAAPCNDFSCYALHKADPAPAEIKDALQFLHEGMRGFYLSLAESPRAARVRVGDRVLVADVVPDFASDAAMQSVL